MGQMVQHFSNTRPHAYGDKKEKVVDQLAHGPSNNYGYYVLAPAEGR